VLKTPSQLQILRDAGVVDAGGFGLQLILEGMLKSIEETEAPAAPVTQPVRAAQVSMDLPEGGWGYCTEFLIEGTNLDLDKIRTQIEGLGNSVLVVGEPELLKVHVHTDDPTRVIALAGGHGKLLKLNVGDMSTQHRRILESESGGPAGAPRANGVGLVAVVAGQGLVEIFKALGVDAIVEGGQTLNPSTQDMLRAVESVPYDIVILLPNNSNVILAAKQVAGVTSKTVNLIETHSVPQGVAAMVAFSPDRTAEENVTAMTAEARRVQTIEVTHAVRDTRSNGLRVKKGDVIGLINEKLEFAGSDYAEVVNKALGKLGPDAYELVTVYRGAGASDDEMAQLESAIRSSYPTLDVEVQQGGQQHYPFILSVE
jgi:DAK2 domain fusion protein YloV